jgi:hypothetical protein
MNVAQLITTLQGFVLAGLLCDDDKVSRDDYFIVTDVYLDVDENGDTVVVID